MGTLAGTFEGPASQSYNQGLLDMPNRRPAELSPPLSPGFMCYISTLKSPLSAQTLLNCNIPNSTML